MLLACSNFMHWFCVNIKEIIVQLFRLMNKMQQYTFGLISWFEKQIVSKKQNITIKNALRVTVNKNMSIIGMLSDLLSRTLSFICLLRVGKYPLV